MIITEKPHSLQKRVYARRPSPHRHATLLWREGDYREIVLRVAASRGFLPNRGYVWRASECGREIQSSIGIVEQAGVSEAGIELHAAKLGIQWVRANIPGAQIRLRSPLERRVLFGDRERARRRAA